MEEIEPALEDLPLALSPHPEGDVVAGVLADSSEIVLMHADDLAEIARFS